jgi:hypothetical protein
VKQVILLPGFCQSKSSGCGAPTILLLPLAFSSLDRPHAITCGASSVFCAQISERKTCGMMALWVWCGSSIRRRFSSGLRKAHISPASLSTSVPAGLSPLTLRLVSYEYVRSKVYLVHSVWNSVANCFKENSGSGHLVLVSSWLSQGLKQGFGFVKILPQFWSRDSAVGIATGYGLTTEGSGFESR